MINVAVDAMGGDNAPGEIVKGAVQAVNKRSDIHVLLVGQEEAKRACLPHVSEGADHTGAGFRGDRDGRAAGECDPQKKGFLHRGGNEPGKEW